MSMFLVQYIFHVLNPPKAGTKTKLELPRSHVSDIRYTPLCLSNPTLPLQQQFAPRLPDASVCRPDLMPNNPVRWRSSPAIFGTPSPLLAFPSWLQRRNGVGRLPFFAVFPCSSDQPRWPLTFTVKVLTKSFHLVLTVLGHRSILRQRPSPSWRAR